MKYYYYENMFIYQGFVLCSMSFFIFRQSLLITLLVKVEAIQHLWSQYNSDDVAEAFQNFIICIEMFFFAIAHYFVFSHKPFIDLAAARAPCIHSCLRMLDVRDIADDMKEHFVDPISRPSFERLRQSFGDVKSDKATSDVESEKDPLFKTGSSGEGSYNSTSGNGELSNDGSLSFSVLTHDQVLVQRQVTKLAVVVEEKREQCHASDSVSNEDKNRLSDQVNSKIPLKDCSSSLS